ncbi:hypothetical protein D3C74_395090 [compost metagenome]
MLEFIHSYTIRNEQQTGRQVIKLVFVRIFLEEQLHPRPCEELHTHGMNLSRFICRPVVFRHCKITALIHLKSMTCFMCQYIDITGCTIEVGEDKWHFVIVQERTISAALFTFFADQIHKLVVGHHLEKCIRLWR